MVTTKKVASKKKVAPVAKADPVVALTQDEQILVKVELGHSLENIAKAHGVTVEYIKKVAGI
jgi:LysM repeat protein